MDQLYMSEMTLEASWWKQKDETPVIPPTFGGGQPAYFISRVVKWNTKALGSWHSFKFSLFVKIWNRLSEPLRSVIIPSAACPVLDPLPTYGRYQERVRQSFIWRVALDSRQQIEPIGARRHQSHRRPRHYLNAFLEIQMGGGSTVMGGGPTAKQVRGH